MEEVPVPAFDTQGATPRPRMGEGTKLCSRDGLKLIKLPGEAEPMVQLVQVVRARPAPGPLDQGPQGGGLRSGPVRGKWSWETNPKVGRI